MPVPVHFTVLQEEILRILTFAPLHGLLLQKSVNVALGILRDFVYHFIAQTGYKIAAKTDCHPSSILEKND